MWIVFLGVFVVLLVKCSSVMFFVVVGVRLYVFGVLCSSEIKLSVFGLDVCLLFLVISSMCFRLGIWLCYLVIL